MNKHRQQGISLVEILVATAIGAIILAGVVQLFTGMKQSEQLSMSLARLQENGRFAIDILSRELRMAGYQGCANPTQDFIEEDNIIAEDFPLTNMSWQMVEGTTVTANGNVSLFDGELTFNGAVEGTDVVSIAYTSTSAVLLDEDMADSSAPINIGTSDERFSVDDVLLISNCTALGQYIFRVSSVSAGTPIMIGHDASKNSRDNFDLLAFEENHTLRRIVLNTYYIDENSRGVRSLFRRSIDGSSNELIEGVDNIKLLYAHYDDNSTSDSQDDSVLWLDADTINSSSNYSWGHVTSIKAAILLSGEQGVLAENGPDSYNMLGLTVATPATDKRLRRVFTTSVKIRNRDGKRISM